MGDQFRTKTAIWTSNTRFSSDFGKILISPESITIKGFPSLVVPKDEIIELRFFKRSRPRFWVIGRKGSEYVCGTFGVFWQRKGKRIYEAIRANGYVFTMEEERLTWRQAGEQAHSIMLKYDLFIASTHPNYAEIMKGRAARALNKLD